jgi:hypothetical protein
MSTKIDHTQKPSSINWPKTPQRQAEEIEQHGQAVQAVAAVGQLMAAASVVPMPRAKKMLNDAAAAAVKPIGAGKRGKGKKRAWEQHADEYFANNNAWDEVNGIYIASTDLLKTSLALTPLLRQPELLAKVKNVRLLTRNIQAITRDTMALATNLAKIRETHKDKVGGTKTQEEMMESCAVFSQYVDFIERYDAALMPIVVHASEQLNEALLELNKTNPELAHALNTNMHNTLTSIREIVAETTGADVVQTPAENDAAVLGEAA